MTSKVHTPRPSGPNSTGAVDLMVGRTKSGSFLRIFYPSKVLDINTQMERWTIWNLGDKYYDGWSRAYFPILPSLYSSLTKFLFKNVLVPTIWEAPVQQGKYPVVIFSHGLLGNRSVLSTICADIASHGYVVAAVEHRDGSATGSFIMNEQNEKEWIPYKVLQKGENEYELRNSQNKTRSKEMSRTLDILELLNKNGVKNELDSYFDLSQFNDKLDLSHPIICGHSFGGSTSLLAISSDHRFTCGILLDPWLFPIKDDIKEITANIEQPLLFILMETFQDDINIKAMKPFQEINSQFVTIREGNHLQQTDVPLILPTYLHLLGGCRSSVERYTAMHLNNKMIMKFIWENSGEKSEWVKDYKKFLGRHKKHLIFEPNGTAHEMIGWNSLPKSSIK